MVSAVAINLIFHPRFLFSNPRKVFYFCVINMTPITHNNVTKLHLLCLFPEIMSTTGNSAIGMGVLVYQPIPFCRLRHVRIFAVENHIS